MDITIYAGELATIIKACADGKVKTFKYSDLEITFHQVDDEPLVNHSYQPIELPTQAQPELTADEVSERAEIADANLLFEDPVAWEEEQMKGQA